MDRNGADRRADDGGTDCSVGNTRAGCAACPARRMHDFRNGVGFGALSNGIASLLVLQFIGGLGSGCFIPLAVLLVLRSLPPRWWTVGIALYALNIETSLNISASVEGFYVDHLSWAWIYWQNVPMAAAMGLCVYFGIAPQ